MKKRAIALVLAAMTALSAAGCAGGSGESASGSASDSAAENGADTEEAAETEEASAETESEDSTGTEKEVINFYEHSDSESIAQQLVDEYNASQDEVEVKLSIISNDDYDDKIKVMLSGGADVDVLWIRSGDSARQLASNGAILALDDYFADNDVDFSVYGDIGDAFIVDDQTYGLLAAKSCWLLFYNKTLFDEAGLDYPIDITWDEYADLCKQVAVDGKSGGLIVDWIMNTGSAAAGEYLDDENLEKTGEYVQFLNRIYNEDQSNMSIEDMTGSFDVYSSFAEGDTYMMIQGDWAFLLEPQYDPDFEWAAAPLPHFEDVPVNSTVGGSGCYSIAANSEHADAAFDFIKFACYSDEGATILAQNSTVASYPSDAALAAYKELVTVPGTEYLFDASVRAEDGIESYYSELKDAYKSEVKDYLIGNISYEECMDNYKTRRDEIMNK